MLYQNCNNVFVKNKIICASINYIIEFKPFYHF